MNNSYIEISTQYILIQSKLQECGTTKGLDKILAEGIEENIESNMKCLEEVNFKLSKLLPLIKSYISKADIVASKEEAEEHGIININTNELKVYIR